MPATKHNITANNPKQSPLTRAILRAFRTRPAQPRRSFAEAFRAAFVRAMRGRR